ncbi:CRAL/TRIO domain-containing protein [Auriscalpium vulgare]|uniref:CRAL/TRIO domain-containing protein n=1 Tax=Auriscalpium vulgare TaxID=40419 RepID=A0ACB8RVD0_9AGAM|nr:CRAL/TRIO domain-containing protein [Auriscalpium vulgare]
MSELSKSSQRDAGNSDGEPQNDLTRDFSVAEWHALKELRSLLPEILEQAYDARPGARTVPITIWGVTLDPNGVRDAQASVVLMKWLRATHIILDVAEAKKNMIATLRWREEFKADEVTAEHFPEAYGKLGHIHGEDKQGRPVIYMYDGNPEASMAAGDAQRLLRWRVALMERAITKCDFKSVDQVVEVSEFGPKPVEEGAAAKALVLELKQILSKHYPDIVAHRLILNVPKAMTWFWCIFNPMIPKYTHERVKVVGGDYSAIRTALLAFIDSQQLPDKYSRAVDSEEA